MRPYAGRLTPLPRPCRHLDLVHPSTLSPYGRHTHAMKALSRAFADRDHTPTSHDAWWEGIERRSEKGLF